MPELPEIETVVRRINASGLVVGRTILSVLVSDARILHGEISSPTLNIGISGNKITKAFRRGKQIVFSLSNGKYLIVHLKLTGNLNMRNSGKPVGWATRLSLKLDNERRLDIDDVQGLAQARLVDDCEAAFSQLGVEPLSPDLNAIGLFNKLNSTNRNIKGALTDQSIIAGIGNIYADEILFAAGIHPRTKSSALSEGQVEQLVAAIRQILQDSIDHEGTSLESVHRGGHYQDYLNVYNRTGLPCPKCKTPIQLIKLNGRSTHFCPNCQSLGVDYTGNHFKQTHVSNAV